MSSSANKRPTEIKLTEEQAGQGRRFIFLINPISGTGKKVIIRELIASTMSSRGFAYEILPTDIHGNYHHLLEKIIIDRITDVIVCGGDGTVNSVASQLHGVDVNVGIIPMGSGNGLALAAGIPTAPTKALNIIVRGNASYVDGFYINNRFSCMLCGMGFDAQVAHDFARQKRRGLQTYIKVSALNYFKAAPYRFSIECNGTTINENAFFICVANSNQFGNNFTIAPKASLNDGLIDVVIVKKMSKLMLPFSIISQASGINALQRVSSHARNKNIIYFQAKELVIKNPDNAPLHIDGDPVDTAPEFQVRVISQAFRLLHP